MLDRQHQGPQCTACGAPMKLTAIEPSDIGHDLRTFGARNARGFSGTSSRVLSLKPG